MMDDNYGTDFLVFTGIIFFLGLTFGWICRKGNAFMIIMGLMFFGPIMLFIMGANLWGVTVPFILGFLVHTGKPLYMRLSK